MTLCAACGLEIQGESVKHHTSYFPEITIQVHRSCHTKIHQSTKHPELKPSITDSQTYYKQASMKIWKADYDFLKKEAESNGRKIISELHLAVEALKEHRGHVVREFK